VSARAGALLAMLALGGCAAAPPLHRASREDHVTAPANRVGPAVELPTPPVLERAAAPAPTIARALSLPNGARAAVITRRDARLVAVAVELAVPPATSWGTRWAFAASLLGGRNETHQHALDRWLIANGVSVHHGVTRDGVVLELAVPAEHLGRALSLVGAEIAEFDVDEGDLDQTRGSLSLVLPRESDADVLAVARRLAEGAISPGAAPGAPEVVAREVSAVTRRDLLALARAVAVGGRVRVAVDGPMSLEAGELALRNAFGAYPAANTPTVAPPRFRGGSALVSDESAAEAAVLVAVRVPTPNGAGAARLCAQAWKDALYQNLRVRRGESYVTDVRVVPFGAHADLRAWTTAKAGTGTRTLAAVMAELARVSATRCGDREQGWADLVRRRSAAAEVDFFANAREALDDLRGGEAPQKTAPSPADVEAVATSLDRSNAIATVVDAGGKRAAAAELDGWQLLH